MVTASITINSAGRESLASREVHHNNIADLNRDLGSVMKLPPNAILFQNLGTQDPYLMGTSLKHSILPGNPITGELSQKETELSELLSTRFIAATRGYTVVKQNPTYNLGGPDSDKLDQKMQRETTDKIAELQQTIGLTNAHLGILDQIELSTRNYITYLLSTNLLQPDDLYNLLIVQNPLHYGQVFDEAARTGRSIVPYLPTKDLQTYATNKGAQIIGQSNEALERLEHKRDFKRLVKQIAARVGYDMYDYPIAAISQRDGETLNASQLEQIRNDVMIDTPFKNGQRPMFFIQLSLSGGGMGNYPVMEKRDGTYYTIDPDEKVIHFKNLQDIVDFVIQFRQDAEVSPFLKPIEGPSLGLLIGEHGVTVEGFFRQKLQNTAYIGFDLDNIDPYGGLDPLAAQTLKDAWPQLSQIALEIGLYQQQNGFRGYSSLDLFIYKDPRKNIYRIGNRIGISENNTRFTATCPAQMLVYNNEKLRNRWLDNKLAFGTDDHTKINQSHTNRPNSIKRYSTLEVLEILKKYNIPLLDPAKDDSIGVVIMTPPDASGNCSMSFFGRDRRERERIRTQVNNAFQRENR